MADPGFEIIAPLFDPPELTAVDDAVVGATTRSRAGVRHLLRFASVRELARDPRLVDIARRFIGGTPAPFKATLFDKSHMSNWLVAWHQDVALPLREQLGVPGWGPWSRKAGQLYAHAPADALARIVALRVHLDDSTAANGPLRVLPGTHQIGRLSGARIDELSRTIEPMECVVDRGGVIAMRPLVVHASSKSRDPLPRRVLHIEYASGLTLERGLELAVA
jgi:hypothetical protein